MSFDAAFARTVGIEGGYSNNPNDAGGETIWGITVAVARRHGYSGPMSDMSMQAARDIYRQDYWGLLHLDAIDPISPAIAAELFDIAVNCGQGVPIPFLQRALNAFNRQGKDYPDVTPDGLAGSATLSALQAFMAKRGPAGGERVMLAALHAQLGVRYLAIVEAKPSQEDFVFGWFANRVAA